MSIIIENISQTTLKSLALAHERCFPGYFLTNLGKDFLEVYYRHYMESGMGFGVVAVGSDGVVQAFAMGVTDLDGQDATLFRKYAGRVIWTVMTRWFVDRDVRIQVMQRLRRFRKVLGRLARGDRSHPEAKAKPEPEVRVAYLTSIGVLPSMRGSGIAQELMRSFEEQVTQRGFFEVRASTSIDNHSAVAFYKKDGWSVRSIREYENGITFSKALG